MNLSRILVVGMLLSCSTIANADEFSVIDERNIYPAPGLQFTFMEAASRRGTVVEHLVEISSGVTGARLDASMAAADPWRAHPLEMIVEREEALAGVAFIPQASRDHAGYLEGFQFLRGTIWSWPAKGPVVVLGADGMMRIVEIPPAETATISDAAGQWTMPLGGINNAPVEGRASLYCGPLAGNAPPLSSWPDGTLLVTLAPSRANTAPAASVWDESLSIAQRLWVQGDPAVANRAFIARDQWVLLIPPTMLEEDRTALLSSGALRFHVPLGDEVPLSLFAIGAGDWFLRDGRLAAESASIAPTTQRTLIAVDGSSRRSWFASFASRSAGPLTDAQVAEILIGRGAAHAVQLPDVGGRLAAISDRVEWTPPPQAIAARTALLAVNRPLDLTLADGDRFRRLRFLVADGETNERGTNPPRAVIDGQVYDHPSANHFWAAPFNPVTGHENDARKPWLELTLEPEAHLAVLDIYHAENSGFSSHFNIRDYRILGRANTAEDWQPMFEVRHESSVARERLRLDPPRALSHLRIEVNDPGFLPNVTTARLAEIIAWGEVRSHRGTTEPE